MISNTRGNHLLAALPQQDQQRVLKRSERVALRRDEILAAPSARVHHVYFPIDSFISVLTGVEPHDSLALGLVGREGMIGTPLVLGVDTSSLHARVQSAGEALRMTAADFQRTLIETRALERRLRRYVDVQFAQFARTASCAVFHVVELRLACWLLMAHDRADGDRLYLTHDHLASMLGIRRSGVTLAAGVLQRAGLITYTRGHIAIVDRKGLERAACGCYRLLRAGGKEAVTSAATPKRASAGAHGRARRTRGDAERHVRLLLAVDSESAAARSPVS